MLRPIATRRRLIARCMGSSPVRVSCQPVATTVLGAGNSQAGTRPSRATVSSTTTTANGPSQYTNPGGAGLRRARTDGAAPRCSARSGPEPAVGTATLTDGTAPTRRQAQPPRSDDQVRPAQTRGPGSDPIRPG
jgi:hypothetical protein